MVYAGKDLSPLGAECGEGHTKTPRLTLIFDQGSSEADGLTDKQNKVMSDVVEAHDSSTHWEHREDS